MTIEQVDEPEIIKMTDYQLIGYIRDYCAHLMDDMVRVDLRNRPEKPGSVR